MYRTLSLLYVQNEFVVLWTFNALLFWLWALLISLCALFIRLWALVIPFCALLIRLCNLFIRLCAFLIRLCALLFWLCDFLTPPCALFIHCTLFMGSLNALVECALYMRSLFLLCALCMHFFHTLFFLRSFYVLFVCPLYMRSYHAVFIWAHSIWFLNVLLNVIMCFCHAHFLSILHVAVVLKFDGSWVDKRRLNYARQETNITATNVNNRASLTTMMEILRSLGLSMISKNFQDERVNVDVVMSTSDEHLIRLGITINRK